MKLFNFGYFSHLQQKMIPRMEKIDEELITKATDDTSTTMKASSREEN